MLTDVDAGKIRSPLSGEKAKLKHHRCWVVLDRKDCYDKAPQVHVHNEEPDAEFSSILDEKHWAEGYLCMPDTDQRYLDFSSAHQSKNGAAYVGTIHEPGEVGRGHHNFVSEVVSPREGRCPPWTATGASVWVLREVNKRATVTRMRNTEGAAAYCTGTHRGFPAELLDDRSYLGQSALGNLVPNNVMDAFYIAALNDISKIQSDGHTPQENWLKQHSLLPEEHSSPASGTRGKRKELEITPELDWKINQVLAKVQDNAKVPKTLEAYSAHVRQWLHVADQRGWSHFLDDLSLAESQRRVLYWLGYELTVHKLSARSMRGKLSALRWHHVRNLRSNPLDDMGLVKEWVASLEKINGPVEQKLPVPVPLLEAIGLSLSDSHDHTTLWAAICTGFWWCLRASEYSADDGSEFDPDRAITWGDVFCSYQKENRQKKIKLIELPGLLQQGKQCEVTLRLFSNKNALQTCTRTVASIKDSPTCAVHALGKLITSTLATHGGLGEKTAVFLLEDGTAVSRSLISDVLKLAAEAAGIPGAKVHGFPLTS